MASRSREVILPISSHEKPPPSLLHPTPTQERASTQERCGPAGIDAKEGHKKNQRTGEALLRIRVFSLEKAPGGPYSSLLASGPVRKMGKDFLSGPVVTGQGVMVLNKRS